MTLTNTTSAVTVPADGATTTFDFDFIVYGSDKTQLFITDAEGVDTEVPNNEYSVTGVGEATGGTFTYPLAGDPVASGNSLTFKRNQPVTQTLDLVNNQPFLAEVIERALDEQTAVSQQQQRDIDRSIKVNEAQSVTPDELLEIITTSATAAAASAAAAATSETNAATSEENAEAAAETLTTQRHIATATEGQTQIVLPFDIDASFPNIAVYINGVFQNTDQYTIDAGSPPTSFTLDEALTAGDIVDVLSNTTQALNDLEALLAPYVKAEQADNVRIETGETTGFSVDAGDNETWLNPTGSNGVNFDKAFAQIRVVHLTIFYQTGVTPTGNFSASPYITAQTTSGFSYNVYLDKVASSQSFKVLWTAIGSD